MTKNIFLIVLTTSLLFATISCTSIKNISLRSELSDNENQYPIKVYMIDRSNFILNNYIITDSTIYGEGTSIKSGNISKFKGHIPLLKISHITSQEVSIIKSVLTFGILAFLTSSVVDALDHNPGYKVTSSKGYYSPNTNGSCPFLYSYNGKEFVLESETYAGAVFKQAERFNYDILRHIQPVNGQFILKLANKKNEMHLTNEISLFAVGCKDNFKILTDDSGNFHTIQTHVKPLSALDFNSSNVIELVNQQDNNYWMSKTENIDFSDSNNYKDGIILEFPLKENSKSCKIIINGKNTMLAEFTFDIIHKLKGEEVYPWYSKLEKDSIERKRFQKFMKEQGRLHIFVFQNSEWVEQSALFDIGPTIARERVGVLDLSNIEGKFLKIKLQSSTDLWKIDNVYLDYSEDLPVKIEKLNLVSAIQSDGKEVTALLKEDDTQYYIAMPNEELKLYFENKTDLKNNIIIAKTKGYYYKLSDENGKEQVFLINNIFDNPSFAKKMYYPLWRKINQDANKKE
ncbi:MAG: hypothetical protein WCT77_10320 [Bacteroidota bacterium]